MRDYEFRGKRLDNGEWVYGSLTVRLVDGYLDHSKKCYFIQYDYMNNYGQVFTDKFEVDSSTIGQLTGLNDKNGKRIYEGDVVCTPFIDPIFGDMINNEIYYEQKWTVTFKEGSFIVDNEDRLIYLYAFSQNGNVEIIGSIHDKENK